jgi:transposase
MATLQIHRDDIAIANIERNTHIIQIVRQRMQVIWLISEKYTRKQAALIAGVCIKSVKNYIRIYRNEGLDGLRALNYKGKTSKLSPQRESIEADFRANPPSSVKQAAIRIKTLTSVSLSLRQIARFLRQIGMKPLKTGSIPAKVNLDTQKHYLENTLQPLVEEAQKGACYLFFMDASHYILSPYTAILWCFSRIFIRAAAGRNRINVLGALEATSLKLETVINTDYINANTIAEMLHLLAQKYSDKPIYIILDNARYQHCIFIKELAIQLGINLVFLPPYSPNFNLIERLWKYIKKNAIYNVYFETPAIFHEAVRKACFMVNHDLLWKTELQNLLTLNFQTFDKINIAQL